MDVLALVDAPDHVCCRYRILAFQPALNRQSIRLHVNALGGGVLQRLAQFSRPIQQNVVLLQRKLLPGWQLRLLRRRAVRLVFDFDDAILFRDSYDPRGPESTRRARRFALTVRLADMVLAGNDFLADCALRAGASPERVRVIPTCISTDLYAPSRGVPPREVGSLVLTWVGSSSTLKGLEQSRSLWDRIGREVPGVKLRVISDRFPDLGAMPVVPIPWSESTEAARLAEGDVGISWIPDDLWSRGKCGLKLLQYGAAGLPSLANPVGVHPEIIEAGVTGFLPDSAEGWVAAVKVLADDPEQRLRMGLRARASIETGFSVKAWEGAFVAAVTGIGGLAAPTPHLVLPKRSDRFTSARRGRENRGIYSVVQGGES
jgi:glycosyltransferase involved in cell wall biosynthesis